MSGTVYNDVNADAARTPFIDVGLGGWTVYVDANENGVFDGNELNAASAPGGAWSITSAAFRIRDTYHVRIVPQSGWRPTEPAAGEYAVSFSTLADTVAGLDFGQTHRALVTGTVFLDENEDGTWDREPVQPGRTVFADANNNGILDTGETSAVTDANGDYALAPPAGTYTIRQVQQPGWSQTFPSPPSDGHPVTLADAQIVTGRRFGNIVATVDLLGAGFAITSASLPVPADGRVDVLYQIRNDGTVDSPGFRADFYLSDDPNITTADTLLRSIAQGAVPRHGTVDRTTTLTLPTPDPFRTDNEYWVGMIVDSEADVAETNESNNSNRGPLLDRFPLTSEGHLPRPVDNITVRAEPVTFGVPIDAALGDEWIGPYDKDVFSFTGQAGHLIGTSGNIFHSRRAQLFNSSWNEVPGDGITNTLFQLPSTGTYYIVVSPVADDTRDPRRLSGRATDLTGPYSLTVRDASPDFIGEHIAVTSPPPGPGHVGVSVRNLGESNPGSVPVALYLSDDEQITPADIFLGTIQTTVHPQSPDPRVYNGGIDVTFPAVDPFRTDNQYWVGMIIDPANQFPELNETNNGNTRTDLQSERHLPSPVDNVNVANVTPLGTSGASAAAIGTEWIGPYDVDAFRVTPNSNERFAFDLDRTNSALDGYLRLYDGAWTLLASNDNAAAPGESVGNEPYLDYLFTTAGTYYVVVSASGNHASDPRRLVGRTAASVGAYTLAVATEPVGPVTGAVFDDANANGLRDVGEAGIPGWTVYLDNNDDELFTPELERSAVTGADGSFQFSGLRAGAYLLRQLPQAGWLRTTPAVHTLALTSGQAAGPFLFGNLREGVVSGAAYHDADRDGTRDAAEAGRQGAVIYSDNNGNRERDLSVVTFNLPGLPVTLQPNSTTTFRIDLPGYRPSQIADVDAAIDILSGSATAWLSRSTGPSVRLFTRTSTSLGRVQISFDDQAATPYQNGDINGAFRPEEPLATFESTEPPDRWYLRIDTGPITMGMNARLFGWSVTFTLSEPFARSEAEGGYVLNGLLPGIHHVRMDPDPDWIETAPAGGEHVVTLAPGDVAADRDFGAFQRRLQVIGRHVFYNNSAFDGRDPAVGAADDDAVATDKAALFAGQARAFANLTSYDKGLNGIMIDVADLTETLTPADFAFKLQSVVDPAVWVDAPAPNAFSVRELAPDRHRVTFTWPDRLLRNRWLQATVLPTDNTRLLAPDVFYFGNLVGKTSGPASLPVVGARDVTFTRAEISRAPVGINHAYDHNRDGWVNIRDVEISRLNLGRSLPPLLFPQAATAQASAGPADRSAPFRRRAGASELLQVEPVRVPR